MLGQGEAEEFLGFKWTLPDIRDSFSFIDKTLQWENSEKRHKKAGSSQLEPLVPAICCGLVETSVRKIDSMHYHHIDAGDSGIYWTIKPPNGVELSCESLCLLMIMTFMVFWTVIDVCFAIQWTTGAGTAEGCGV